MIEKIKSLKNKVAINLYNKNAEYIYNLDSINLIIGNNGTGKTTLIKSIIRDLITSGSPIEFIAEGATDALGIIYYSATPFHKPMKSVIKDNVAFLDASETQQEKQSFVEAAEEYLAISKLLGLDKNLRSVQSFDIGELCFELARQIATGSILRDQNTTLMSEKLRKAFVNYREADREYNRTNRRISTFNQYVLNETHLNNIDKDYESELRELYLRLESSAKDVIGSKEAVSQIFISDSGLLDDDKLVDWITTATLLKSRFSPREKRDLALHMYKNKLDDMEEGSFVERSWTNHRAKVEKFIDLIHRTQSGTVKFRHGQIDLAINMPRLMKANADPQIIETAHKLGLVKIGFDTMSSGQAAIMHQMISISHSIQELKMLRKKNVLIFIDEGDLLLHLNWQREYISLIDNRLKNFKKGRDKLDSLQVVIATHSPLLASDVLRDSITRLDEGTKLPSFGAPIQQIINYSFGTPSIGLLSQSVINKLKNKEKFTTDDIDVVQQIDDDFIREYMLKKASK